MSLAVRILIRVAVTAAILGALVFALWLSPYDFDFGKTWGYRALFLEALLMTLLATAAAYAMGLPLGILVALTRMSRLLPLRHVGDLYVEVIRGTPFLVQIMLFYFGIAPLFGLDNKWVVGTVALAVFAAAYIGEIFRAGIESIDRGQVEAARSLGLSRGQAMRHVVLPQAFRRMIPPLTGELIALTKESSLLFCIGFVELVAVAKQVGADSYGYFEPFIVAACLYLVLTVPLSFLARRLERRLARGQQVGAHL